MRQYDTIESEDLYDMAVEWMERGDFEKAEHQLKRAISLNPRFIYAYITLARLYGRVKNYSMAVGLLKKAREQDPAFHRLDYLMAKYAYKAGDYPLSLRCIEKAIEKSPEMLYRKSREVIRRASGSAFSARAGGATV
ncbi:MAG TPA: tetratricopeptide repeat protein [Spirochaetes bacterium]|nr:tetratricopeptide repeat protein [Spirochaetota bacterium]